MRLYAFLYVYFLVHSYNVDNLQLFKYLVMEVSVLIYIFYLFSYRGIKAGTSFSIFEVVVGCEIADNKTTEHKDDSTDCRRKTIFLHLKKFFRGTRFTSLPFLRIVEQKHKEGDFVCVSGKVSLLIFLLVQYPFFFYRMLVR